MIIAEAAVSGVWSNRYFLRDPDVCIPWSLFDPCMLHALVPIWSLLVHFCLYFTVCCTSWSLFDPYLVPLCCTPSSHLVPIWSLLYTLVSISLYAARLVPVCCTPSSHLVPIWSLFVHFGPYFTVCCMPWSLYAACHRPIWSLFGPFLYTLVSISLYDARPGPYLIPI